MMVRWLGRVEYLAAWALQKELVGLRSAGTIGDTLLLLEHYPTVTLGRGADQSHLLASASILESLGVTVHHVDRGGDITYHGPGQLVGYPVFDLADQGRDLHLFLRNMEAALVDVLTELGLAASRFPPHTGVWIGHRKIAAIGVKVTRWITSHGFALNVHPDLAHFDLIVPCGIHEHGVTSLAQEGLGDVVVEDLLAPVAVAFRRRFSALEHSTTDPASILTAESGQIWSSGEDV